MIRKCTVSLYTHTPLPAINIIQVWNICYKRWDNIDKLLLTKVHSWHHGSLSVLGLHKCMMTCVHHHDILHREDSFCWRSSVSCLFIPPSAQCFLIKNKENRKSLQKESRKILAFQEQSPFPISPPLTVGEGVCLPEPSREGPASCQLPQGFSHLPSTALSKARDHRATHTQGLAVEGINAHVT